MLYGESESKSKGFVFVVSVISNKRYLKFVTQQKGRGSWENCEQYEKARRCLWCSF